MSDLLQQFSMMTESHWILMIGWLKFFLGIIVTGLFCYRMQQEGIIERNCELISNLRMRKTPRRHRNAQGEFVAAADNRFEHSENEFAANTDEERQIMGPVENDTFGALGLLTKWRISITPSKAHICLWAFITSTNLLYTLSVVTFWISLIMCVKTFPAWHGVGRLFDGITRRQKKNMAWNEMNPNDNILLDLFPEEETEKAYTLHVSLTEGTGSSPSVAWQHAIALRFENPLFWLTLVILALIASYHLSLVHGCLKRAYRAVSRRRSP